MMHTDFSAVKEWPAGMLKGAKGRIGWESPANIALVKYWGKYPGQLPMNPSLSFVLRESVVRIRMSYVYSDEGALVSFSLNGQPNDRFKKRISGYLDSLHPFLPFLKHLELIIESNSTFPHSAGIASSAAAFSALALCLCGIEAELAKQTIPEQEFLRKASYMARLGSGSACRSLYGGLALWGKTEGHIWTSDDYAVPLAEGDVHKVYSALQDAVLIVDAGEKAVSSSAGHALMAGHPYRGSRISQAATSTQRMLDVLRSGDTGRFIDIIEAEALSLHGLMMASDPGFILMRPNTIRALEKIRNFRRDTGLEVGFTLDAGPNIHLIYFEQDQGPVKAFIKDELSDLCQQGQWIDDGMGDGPNRINEA